MGMGASVPLSRDANVRASGGPSGDQVGAEWADEWADEWAEEWADDWADEWADEWADDRLLVEAFRLNLQTDSSSVSQLCQMPGKGGNKPAEEARKSRAEARYKKSEGGKCVIDAPQVG